MNKIVPYEDYWFLQKKVKLFIDNPLKPQFYIQNTDIMKRRPIIEITKKKVSGRNRWYINLKGGNGEIVFHAPGNLNSMSSVVKALNVLWNAENAKMIWEDEK